MANRVFNITFTDGACTLVHSNHLSNGGFFDFACKVSYNTL